jgi:hypothetical protein
MVSLQGLKRFNFAVSVQINRGFMMLCADAHGDEFVHRNSPTLPFPNQTNGD